MIDPAKISGITDWLPPSSCDHQSVRSKLGLSYVYFWFLHFFLWFFIGLFIPNFVLWYVYSFLFKRPLRRFITEGTGICMRANIARQRPKDGGSFIFFYCFWIVTSEKPVIVPPDTDQKFLLTWMLLGLPHWIFALMEWLLLPSATRIYGLFIWWLFLSIVFVISFLFISLLRPMVYLFNLGSFCIDHCLF